MIKSLESTSKRMVQTCGSCGQDNVHQYRALSIGPAKVIQLPPCPNCNSIEFLLLTGKTRDHDMKVAVVFAEINAMN